MTQAQLQLTGGVNPPAGVEWQRTPMMARTNCGARYTMTVDGTPTGWCVQHCGHPTANRPYYIIDPQGRTSARKYVRVKDARSDAEKQYRESAT